MPWMRHTRTGSCTATSSPPTSSSPADIRRRSSTSAWPEQARAEPLDARTDLFSFGAVLYEMSTGRMAFSANTPAVIFAAILERMPVAVTRLNPDVSPELERIITKALEKDRNMRYQSAAEMRADLLRLQRDSGSARAAIDSTRAISAPSATPGTTVNAGPVVRPDVRFCVAADGARVAYAVHGTGPLLVRVLGHFTHLEMEWEWPALRLLWEGLSAKHTVVRYDGRGTDYPITGPARSPKKRVNSISRPFSTPSRRRKWRCWASPKAVGRQPSTRTPTRSASFI
jgi:hypothetical protein